MVGYLHDLHDLGNHQGCHADDAVTPPKLGKFIWYPL